MADYNIIWVSCVFESMGISVPLKICLQIGVICFLIILGRTPLMKLITIRNEHILQKMILLIFCVFHFYSFTLREKKIDKNKNEHE